MRLRRPTSAHPPSPPHSPAQASAAGNSGGRSHYYGWVVAGTLAVTETVSWGILFYAFSVFLVPMQRELGWSLSALTGAYSLALLASGLAAPAVGRWLDRHGPRALMTVGSVAGSLLLLAWAAVDDLRVFYLIWVGLGLAMAATLYEPAFATLAVWFDRDRRRAFLLLTVAAGFASTIFLPLAGWLVATLGWRRALVALAAILAGSTIVPHALLLRRRPRDLGLLPDGATTETQAASSGLHLSGTTLPAALRDPSFWWLTIAFFFDTFAVVAVGVHLIPYLTERGSDPAFAATATGLIGAAQVAARLLVTGLGGRMSQIRLTASLFAVEGGALVVLLLWSSAASVLIAVLLLGAGRGAVTLMRATVIADRYGPAHYGAISGMLAFLLTAARAAAPVGGGLAEVWLGGYRPVFWGLVGCSVVAVIAILASGQPRRGQASPPTRIDRPVTTQGR